MTLRTRVAVLLAMLVAVAAAISGVLSFRATRNEALATIDSFLESRATRVIPEASPSETPPLGRPLSEAPPPGVPPPAVPPGQAEPIFIDIVDGQLPLPFPPPPPFGDDSPPPPPPLTLDDVIANDAVFGVIDADGNVVIATDDMITDFVGDDLDPGVVRRRSVSTEEARYRVRAERFLDGVITVNARSLDETDATLSAVRVRLFLVAIVTTLIAALLGFLAAGYLVKPLRRLSALAEKIADTGEPTGELVTSARDEVGQLASSFERMLEALRRSRHQQQQLIEDTSHELRTPLTTIRANVDLLEGGKLSDDDRLVALSLIRSEVDELTQLSTELSEVASAETQVLHKEDVDVVELVRAAVAREQRRHGRPIDLETPKYQRVVINGNAGALDRAVSNLLGNAVKFSPDDAPILTRVESHCVSVVDHGSGIPSGDIDSVFERFHRADDARRMSGSGLGLAIVRDTALAHNGAPFARNHPTGATVGFTFRS